MAQGRGFIESLCDLEIPGALKFSPNGQSIVYSTGLTWGHRKGRHDVSTIWLASTGQAKSSRQLTSGSCNDYAPAWHPNGESIAFISDRAKIGEKWALYILPLLRGNEAYPIIDVENKAMISSFAFSPNGEFVAFLSADEKTAAQQYREDNGGDVHVWGEDWPYARLRVVNLITKEVKSLHIARHVMDVCWSPDSKAIGMVSCKSPDIEEKLLSGSMISKIDVGLVTKVDICKFPKNLTNLTWASDGGLYFCAGVPAEKIFAGQGVYTVHATKHQSCYERVAFGLEDDAMELVNVKGRIFIKVDHRLESRICLLDGKVLYSRQEELESFDVTFASDGGETILVVATSNINHPVEVFTTDVANNAMVQLSNHGREFASRPFGTCNSLSCPSSDEEVDLDALYLTPLTGTTMASCAETPKPLPTVVLIHGGPNTRITNAFNAYYYMLTPYLLSLGYGILLPNYRGSSGRGQRFASYAIGGTCDYDYKDIITLTQHAVEQGFANKERLLVGGWSQGGMLTLLCSVRNGLHGHGWKFKAGIPGAAISDSDAMALTSDLGCTFQPELNNGRVSWNMDRNDTSTRKISPLWEFNEAVQRSELTKDMIIPPLLILHGEEDARCPVTQAWGIRRALQSRSLPYEFVTYPRQGHFFSEQNFWIDMVMRIGRWCDTYIGT